MPNSKTILTIAAVSAGTFIGLEVVAIVSGGRADWRRLADMIASPFLPSKPKNIGGQTPNPTAGETAASQTATQQTP